MLILWDNLCKVRWNLQKETAFSMFFTLHKIGLKDWAKKVKDFIIYSHNRWKLPWKEIPLSSEINNLCKTINYCLNENNLLY